MKRKTQMKRKMQAAVVVQFRKPLVLRERDIPSPAKGHTPKEAAPIICAGITTYKGIKQTEATPAQWIAISGAGGLGHVAIQYAKAMGLQVCAIDIDDGKLAHATRLGADFVVNAKAGDPAAA